MVIEPRLKNIVVSLNLWGLKTWGGKGISALKCACKISHIDIFYYFVIKLPVLVI